MNKSTYKPRQRRFRYDDPFFEEGNLACMCRNTTVDDDIDFIIDSLDSVQIAEFTCHVKGCSKTFTNPMQFNRHFDMLHKFRCEHCYRNFPSNYLLGLHLQENHDSFFEAQKEKGLAVYECIIESCSEKFTTEELRKKHLVKTHKYPADFRFNAVKRVHAKYKTTLKGKNKEEQHKKKKQDKNVKNNIAENETKLLDKDTSKCAITDNQEEGMEESMEGVAADVSNQRVTGPSRRRKKKKKQNSNNSMDVEISESASIIAENDEEELSDATMASSPNRFQYKKTAPKSISFGRGVQRGLTRTKCK